MRSHFALDLALLCHVFPPSCSTSSLHLLGGLPRSRFCSIGHHSATARVHLSSFVRATWPAQRSFCFRYSAITSRTPVLRRISSHRMCWRSDIPNIHLSIALCAVVSRLSSFFVVAHISLAYSMTGRTVLLNRWARRVLLIFFFSISFIELDVLHSALIRRVISGCMSRSIFTICPK
ncbi:hypothetical protein Tcan_00271 [Toxocara canis]|uniref:Secreted protein n=1 Tax=Toxocara canis TaxID=6265 RepID=A0A0B2V9V4_TOXCA|nr:hypothetical protein Tcan_00271 [Toxocara canis]